MIVLRLMPVSRSVLRIEQPSIKLFERIPGIPLRLSNGCVLCRSRFSPLHLCQTKKFGKRAGAEVRFIEYMDVGGATQWSRSKVVSRFDNGSAKA